MYKKRYEILLAELAVVLEQKNNTIMFLNYEIDKLKNKLADAEQELNEAAGLKCAES
jgi:phage shock protein A|nr:MAG TPA: A-type inclusion protein repeat protein [Caudoviricetes sp.]